MASNISIKWYHNDGEIRRFAMEIPADGNGAYVKLINKLDNILPGTTFQGRIGWKDEDGDSIRLTSDGELKEAVRYATGGVLKIYTFSGTSRASSVLSDSVSILSQEPAPTEWKPATAAPAADGETEKTKDDNRETKDGGEDEKKPNENQPAHPGVVCDGCNTAISHGARYKCLVCFDFDLCATCEGYGKHPEHPMIRIMNSRDPTWRQFTGRRPGWMGGCGGRRGRGGPYGFNFGGRGGHGEFHRQHFQAAQDAHRAAHDAARAATNGAGGPQPPAPDFHQIADAGAEFLKQVGEQVATALTNLGIDVDVDVEHPRTGERENLPNRNKTESDEKKADGTKANKTEVKTSIVADNGASKKTEAVAAEEEKEVVSPVNQNEWTLVENPPAMATNPTTPNEEEQPKTTSFSTTTVTGTGPSATTTLTNNVTTTRTTTGNGNHPTNIIPDHQYGTTTTNTVYPTLPPTTAPQVNATNPAAVHHPDPTIHHAVEHMMAMGFTNEGGWLTQLLELKRGDISSALDALAPASRRQN